MVHQPILSRLRSLAPLVLALGLCGATGALAQEPKGSSFVDNFERFDTKRWMASDGWVNGDHQNCTWSKREVTVRDGKLLVGFSGTPFKERQSSCGEIQTRPTFGYGTYEARIKTPKGSGLNANIFTYIGQVHGKPHDEIDFEFLLKDTSKVQLNVFAAGKGKNEYMAPLDTPSDEGFADYAFVWAPDSITWYINGKEVHRIDDPSKQPKNDAKIYLSLWGTDTLKDWMGPFEMPPERVQMEVERVAFTAAGEPCQFPESLVCATQGQ